MRCAPPGYSLASGQRPQPRQMSAIIISASARAARKARSTSGRRNIGWASCGRLARNRMRSLPNPLAMHHSAPRASRLRCNLSSLSRVRTATPDTRISALMFGAPSCRVGPPGGLNHSRARLLVQRAAVANILSNLEGIIPPPHATRVRAGTIAVACRGRGN